MTKNEALEILRTNITKNEYGKRMVPYSVVESVIEKLFDEKEITEDARKKVGKIVNHPRDINMQHRHQIINGCKVVFYDDRVEIINMKNCVRKVLKKERYKTLEGLKRAVINYTKKMGIGYY